MKQKLKFNERMILIAKKYSLALKWQQLKYGFSRAVIDCGSYEEMYAVEKLLTSKANAACDRWSCNLGGVFEGVVYAMDAADKAELDRICNEERARVEDWWQRYHVADDETRRLMACGAIV